MKPSRQSRLLVWARDGGRCVRCGRFLDLDAPFPTSIHHRRPRGAGGTRRIDTNLPQNLILLCGSGTTGCHGHIESHRTESYLAGLLVHSAHDPLEVAVLTFRGWVYLTADGSYVDTDVAS